MPRRSPPGRADRRRRSGWRRSAPLPPAAAASTGVRGRAPEPDSNRLAIADDEPQLGTPNLEPTEFDVPVQQRPERKRHIDPVHPRHLRHPRDRARRRPPGSADRRRTAGGSTASCPAMRASIFSTAIRRMISPPRSVSAKVQRPPTRHERTRQNDQDRHPGDAQAGASFKRPPRSRSAGCTRRRSPGGRLGTEEAEAAVVDGVRLLGRSMAPVSASVGRAPAASRTAAGAPGPAGWARWASGSAGRRRPPTARPEGRPTPKRPVVT